MPATAGTTTIELPLPVKARLAKLRAHPRQAYYEVVSAALDALEGRGKHGLDPLVARHAVALRVAARRHKLSRIWLFGSRARGEARPDSDVDILYQADPTADLFDLAGFMADAQDILGVDVDLLSVATQKEPLRSRVMAEAVSI
jgi:uncharacterized protein